MGRIEKAVERRVGSGLLLVPLVACPRLPSWNRLINTRLSIISIILDSYLTANIVAFVKLVIGEVFGSLRVVLKENEF